MATALQTLTLRPPHGLGQGGIDLMGHVEQFASGGNAIRLFRNTENAMTLYRSISEGGVYDQHDELTKRRLLGGYIRQDRKQRRYVRIYAPVKTKGRPKKLAKDVLVSFLAYAFSAATGKMASLRAVAQPPSPFELFLTPIFEELKLVDVRGSVAKHVRIRQTLFK